jgi:death-on-curing protein
VVLAIHDAQLAEHGGGPGVRDPGLLDSALARPRNAAADGKSEVHKLAGLYAAGIIKNHPFVDGNKRVGLVLLELFLELNGFELVAPDEDCYVAIDSLAAGALDEQELWALVEPLSP